MKSIARESALQIISRVRISEVCRQAACTELRRTGPDTWRAHATWRNGDGWSVTLNDSRNVFHDFVTGEGGGVLDLVMLIRGGSRQDALRWVAGFAGVPLDEQSFSEEQRAHWAEEQRELERDLPDARHWRNRA